MSQSQKRSSVQVQFDFQVGKYLKGKQFTLHLSADDLSDEALIARMSDVLNLRDNKPVQILNKRLVVG